MFDEVYTVTLQRIWVLELYHYTQIRSFMIIDMMDTISSILSSVLSGLRVYLAEKHIKQDREEATSPFDRVVAAPFWAFYPLFQNKWSSEVFTFMLDASTHITLSMSSVWIRAVQHVSFEIKLVTRILCRSCLPSSFRSSISSLLYF